MAVLDKTIIIDVVQTPCLVLVAMDSAHRAQNALRLHPRTYISIIIERVVGGLWIVDEWLLITSFHNKHKVVRWW